MENSSPLNLPQKKEIFTSNYVFFCLFLFNYLHFFAQSKKISFLVLIKF